MPASVTITPTSKVRITEPMTITGAGFAATTQFRVSVLAANRRNDIDVTSDGSGAFVVTAPAMLEATHTVEVRPKAEWTGTTTALTTTTKRNRN